MSTHAIGLLHPGEMGAAIGAVLVKSGQQVLYCAAGRSSASVRRAKDAGLVDTSFADLVRDSEVVFSICPPHAAIDVASQVTGFSGLYVDANAIAPGTALQVATIIENAGGRYVDGGILGPPPGAQMRTRLCLSGKEAAEVAQLFSGEQVTVNMLGDSPTAASAIKMAFGAWTKGSNGLLVLIRAFARAEGIEDDFMTQLTGSWPQLGDQSLRAAQQAITKGWRWVGEMEEIAASLQAVGLSGDIYSGFADLYGHSGRKEKASVSEETLSEVLSCLGATPRHEGDVS